MLDAGFGFLLKKMRQIRTLKKVLSWKPKKFLRWRLKKFLRSPVLKVEDAVGLPRQLPRIGDAVGLLRQLPRIGDAVGSPRQLPRIGDAVGSPRQLPRIGDAVRLPPPRAALRRGDVVRPAVTLMVNICARWSSL